jgi:tyrosyl-tRNA synthetase
VPPGTAIVDLLAETGLVRSTGEARRTIGEGGAYLNNQRISDPDYVPRGADLLHGSWLVLRRGKKSLAGVQVG